MRRLFQITKKVNNNTMIPHLYSVSRCVFFYNSLQHLPPLPVPAKCLTLLFIQNRSDINGGVYKCWAP